MKKVITDIYLVALLKLKKIDNFIIKKNGKSIEFIYEFEIEKINEILSEHYKGNILINSKEFINEIQNLKDLLKNL